MKKGLALLLLGLFLSTSASAGVYLIDNDHGTCEKTCEIEFWGYDILEAQKRPFNQCECWVDDGLDDGENGED